MICCQVLVYLQWIKENDSFIIWIYKIFQLENLGLSAYCVTFFNEFVFIRVNGHCRLHIIRFMFIRLIKRGYNLHPRQKTNLFQMYILSEIPSWAIIRPHEECPLIYKYISQPFNVYLAPAKYWSGGHWISGSTIYLVYPKYLYMAALFI